MRTILVTGAGGFAGRHLLPALREAFPGAAVIGTARRPEPGLHDLDVTDAAQAGRLLAELQPDGCIHLAAVSSLAAAARDPEQAWRVNLGGALAVARAVQLHAPHCTLLFVSSSEIYGDSFRAGMPLDEAALPAPRNAYAATKAAADLAMGALAAEGLRVIRVRPFNHTGPGQSPGFVVPDFARQVALIAAGRQAPVLHTGALDTKRDFLDVRDVCAAYVACLRHAATLPPGTILNIASGVARRIGDVLADLLAIAGIAAEIRPAERLRRSSDIATSLGDARRARDLLGWRPAIDWQATLREVLEDWRGRIG
jgi:GDP-4-dehydro-6-deoxy-D-mannose reductase